MNQRILHVYQAEPTGSEAVPELHLIADCPPPRAIDRGKCREAYYQQAMAIVEGMRESWPQGLVDAVLAEMLRSLGSVCVLAYGREV